MRRIFELAGTLELELSRDIFRFLSSCLLIKIYPTLLQQQSKTVLENVPERYNCNMTHFGCDFRVLCVLPRVTSVFGARVRVGRSREKFRATQTQVVNWP